ncbi:hypothetical protein HNR19_001287 [Nocardioides thalensis]|uniref:DUF6801 domain-containing protein n=1 Tax=Nocardioides thalensis TaxID=1914755 RepID=A0A853BZK5_9ACTN|nr:DUF6801 domain-containing protein [Nocardioides thalensis]NYJ00589.1 hypothetical protein [Nocardioides thalensis]
MTRLRILVLALLATVFVAAGGPPAHGVDYDHETSYSCTSAYGGGTAAGVVSVGLPKRVQAGERLRARPIEVTIVVPSDLVDTLRENDVDSIEGTSDDATYRLKKRGTKAIVKPINDLVVPETAVPAEGDMTLIGTGTASGHTFRRAGLYSVLVPKAFTADGTAHGVPIVGDLDFTMSCALASGAPAKIASLRVVR